jgi:NADPH-dependent 2,4-dienoyl-CoA reductase/sulfur reductase-like enzyme
VGIGSSLLDTDTAPVQRGGSASVLLVVSWTRGQTLAVTSFEDAMGSEHYDVIIIGSGPGGGSMAWKLARTGKRILLIERGDYLRRGRENWDSKTVFVDAHY